MSAQKDFWKIYLEKPVEEMMNGQKWYDFSMASLRTLRELGLARKCGKKFFIVEHNGYRINVNAIGRILSMVHGTKTYRRNSLPFELFSVSLPIQSIEAR